MKCEESIEGKDTEDISECKSSSEAFIALDAVYLMCTLSLVSVADKKLKWRLQ